MAGDKPDIFERSQRDLDASRPWVVRDRLVSHLAVRPDDQRARATLGDAYMRLSDLPAAGRIWFLCDRTGPEVEEAIAAFREDCAQSGLEMLSRLPALRPDLKWPEPVLDRLDELEGAASRERARSIAKDYYDAPEHPEPKNDGCLGAVAVLLGIGFIGLLVLAIVAFIVASLVVAIVELVN